MKLSLVEIKRKQNRAGLNAISKIQGMDFGLIEAERIAKLNDLKSHIGKEICDNFSPTLKSKIVKYQGGHFILEAPSYKRRVSLSTLDIMIYGR